jgi:hypothetical protein
LLLRIRNPPLRPPNVGTRGRNVLALGGSARLVTSG